MKMIFVLLLILAGIGGYYFGYDRGFEKSAGQSNKTDMKKEASETPEEHSTIKPSTAIARDIIGAWKSTDDSKFTRQFAADSTVIDTYQGDEAATLHAMWKTFMSTDGESTPFDLKEGIVYLKVTTPEEVMFFKILRITSDTLEMTYVGGDTLRFTKVR